MREAVEFHEKLAPVWESKYWRLSFAAREKVLEECIEGMDLKGKKWLDAGCGTGKLSRMLSAKGCIVHCVDASEGMIEIAKKQADKDPDARNMSFEKIETIEKLGCPDNSYDGILCSSVIEYLERPEDCLAELARALKPGGILVVSVPNKYSIVRRALIRIYRLTKALGRPWPMYLEYSKQEYSSEEFKKKLQENGFETNNRIIFGYPPPAFLHRMRWMGSLIMFVASRKG